MVAVHDEHPQLLHVEWVPFDADSLPRLFYPAARLAGSIVVRHVQLIDWDRLVCGVPV